MFLSQRNFHKFRYFRFAFTALFAIVGIFPRAYSENSQPNFVVIVADDQRFDELNSTVTPNTERRIFNAGVEFSRAYITTPLCCPSRASLLTGQYASKNQVIGNSFALTSQTFVPLLHDAGYYTGHIGKFLNTWDGTPRPEYSEWMGSAGGAAKYFNPKINHDGEWRNHEGYTSDVYADLAVEFLKNAASSGHPFFLNIAYPNPHFPSTPPDRYRTAFKNLLPPRSPSVTEKDLSDKPIWLQKVHSTSKRITKRANIFYQKRLQTLAALDDSVGVILDALKELNLEQDTVVVFISDNGLFLGEHGLRSKGAVYEEGVRTPFAIRFPSLVTAKQTNDSLVGNIDIAPTILDLAGVSIPAEMDGKSLLPILKRERNSVRDTLLLEGWASRSDKRLGWAAIMTHRFLFVRNDRDRNELYDREFDPFQLDNLAGAPEYSQEESGLNSELTSLLLGVRGTTSFNQPKGTKGRTKFK